MAAGVLFFTLLARWVLSGASMPFDTAIRAAVHAGASPPLTAVMLAITSLGAQFSMCRRAPSWFGIGQPRAGGASRFTSPSSA